MATLEGLEPSFPPPLPHRISGALLPNPNTLSNVSLELFLTTSTENPTITGIIDNNQTTNVCSPRRASKLTHPTKCTCLNRGPRLVVHLHLADFLKMSDKEVEMWVKKKPTARARNAAGIRKSFGVVGRRYTLMKSPRSILCTPTRKSKGQGVLVGLDGGESDRCACGAYRGAAAIRRYGFRGEYENEEDEEDEVLLEMDDEDISPESPVPEPVSAQWSSVNTTPGTPRTPKKHNKATNILLSTFRTPTPKLHSTPKKSLIISSPINLLHSTTVNNVSDIDIIATPLLPIKQWPEGLFGPEPTSDPATRPRPDSRIPILRSRRFRRSTLPRPKAIWLTTEQTRKLPLPTLGGQKDEVPIIPPSPRSKLNTKRHGQTDVPKEACQKKVLEKAMREAMGVISLEEEEVWDEVLRGYPSGNKREADARLKAFYGMAPSPNDVEKRLQRLQDMYEERISSPTATDEEIYQERPIKGETESATKTTLPTSPAQFLQGNKLHKDVFGRPVARREGQSGLKFTVPTLPTLPSPQFHASQPHLQVPDSPTPHSRSTSRSRRSTSPTRNPGIQTIQVEIYGELRPRPIGTPPPRTPPQKITPKQSFTTTTTAPPIYDPHLVLQKPSLPELRPKVHTPPQGFTVGDIFTSPPLVTQQPAPPQPSPQLYLSPQTDRRPAPSDLIHPNQLYKPHNLYPSNKSNASSYSLRTCHSQMSSPRSGFGDLVIGYIPSPPRSLHVDQRRTTPSSPARSLAELVGEELELETGLGKGSRVDAHANGENTGEGGAGSEQRHIQWETTLMTPPRVPATAQIMGVEKRWGRQLDGIGIAQEDRQSAASNESRGTSHGTLEWPSTPPRRV